MTHTSRKILFLTTSAPRYEGDSSAPFILQQAVELQKLGYQVDILAPHAPGIKLQETLEGVRIYRYRYLPQRMQTLCYGGGIPSNLRQKPLRKLQIPFLLTSMYFSALRLGIKHRYDLIHSHWVIPSGIVGGWISWFMNIPHIVSVHGGDVTVFQHPRITSIKSYVVQKAHYVIANSSYTQQLVQIIFPYCRLAVIPTGVDTLREPCHSLPERELYAPEGTDLLIFTGRVVEEKGVAYAIEALALLRQKNKKVNLLVVGAGDYLENCKDIALISGMQAYVCFTGAVPPSDIPDYLAIADIFVGPSCTGENGWVEGQGNSFVEAMVAGIPVVATRSGGIPDAIQHERTGLLVPERNAEALANAIGRLLDDKPLAQQLAMAGRQHAKKHFSREVCAEKIAAIYEKTWEEKRF